MVVVIAVVSSTSVLGFFLGISVGGAIGALSINSAALPINSAVFFSILTSSFSCSSCMNLQRSPNLHELFKKNLQWVLLRFFTTSASWLNGHLSPLLHSPCQANALHASFLWRLSFLLAFFLSFFALLFFCFFFFGPVVVLFSIILRSSSFVSCLKLSNSSLVNGLNTFFSLKLELFRTPLATFKVLPGFSPGSTISVSTISGSSSFFVRYSRSHLSSSSRRSFARSPIPCCR